MWTREELKTRAKANLKRYYWAAFLVSLIFSLVGGSGGNSGGNTNTTVNQGNGSYGIVEEYLPEEFSDSLGGAAGIIESAPIGSGNVGLRLGRVFLGAVAGVLVILLIVALLLWVFVAPVMEVGRNRFYMESRLTGRSAGVGKILWGFTHNYLNIIWTMFLRGLFITLGTICCVIPGIYLSYCYYLVPYILSENPEMRPMEAMRLSKEMMEGHKFNTFVLELSFIGWKLLGMLACGVGLFFVQPYVDATMAELYAVLRQPYGGGLNGFGYPDVVPTGTFGGEYVNSEHVYGNGYGQDQSYGSGYDQSQGYGGGYGQNQGYGGGYGQNQGYGGGYDQSRGYGGGYDQNQGCGGGCGQNQNYGSGDGQGFGDPAQGQETTQESSRDMNVSRSEGGPGRGYYLNGEFHPYTEDDK